MCKHLQKMWQSPHPEQKIWYILTVGDSRHGCRRSCSHNRSCWQGHAWDFSQFSQISGFRILSESNQNGVEMHFECDFHLSDSNFNQVLLVLSVEKQQFLTALLLQWSDTQWVDRNSSSWLPFCYSDQTHSDWTETALPDCPFLTLIRHTVSWQKQQFLTALLLRWSDTLWPVCSDHSFFWLCFRSVLCPSESFSNCKRLAPWRSVFRKIRLWNVISVWS